MLVGRGDPAGCLSRRLLALLLFLRSRAAARLHLLLRAFLGVTAGVAGPPPTAANHRDAKLCSMFGGKMKLNIHPNAIHLLQPWV